jgi:hypothetical protein
MQYCVACSFSLKRGIEKTMKTKLLVAGVAVLAVAGVWLWLADRPADTPPHIPEGMGIMFDPRFSPRTPKGVQEYLERRAARGNWRGDRASAAGQRAWADAVDTLQRRWGLTPEMTQEEIDGVLRQREEIWAFVQHTKTPRYKIRSWLGLNK